MKKERIWKKLIINEWRRRKWMKGNKEFIERNGKNKWNNARVIWMKCAEWKKKEIIERKKKWKKEESNKRNTKWINLVRNW